MLEMATVWGLPFPLFCMSIMSAGEALPRLGTAKDPAALWAEGKTHRISGLAEDSSSRFFQDGVHDERSGIARDLEVAH